MSVGNGIYSKNNLNNNANYIEVDVKNSPEGASPIGAVVKVTACKKSQVRRVGSSSAPYSQSRDTMIHFGLGNCQRIDSVKIQWPTGEEQLTDKAKINQVYRF